MTGPRITSTELTTAQVAEILALVGAARLADGVAPLSEHVMLHLRYDSTGGRPGFHPHRGRRDRGLRLPGPAVGQGARAR